MVHESGNFSVSANAHNYSRIFLGALTIIIRVILIGYSSFLLFSPPNIIVRKKSLDRSNIFQCVSTE